MMPNFQMKFTRSAAMIVVAAALAAHPCEGAVASGDSFDATLTTMDGAQLHCPRDLLGKVTVLYFWTMAQPLEMPYMRSFYELYRNQDVQMIGINLDKDPAQVKAFIREQGMTWPQVCTGQGADDPLFKRLGIPETPFFWVVGWDGRVVLDNNPVGRKNLTAFLGAQWERDHPGQVFEVPAGGFLMLSLNSVTSTVEFLLEGRGDLAERWPCYRSGEFLAFSSFSPPSGGDSKGAKPQPGIEALWRKLLTPRWTGLSQAGKIQSFKELLAAGEALERKRLSTGDLSLARSWMLIAAKWLAITTGDKTYAEQAAAIANRMLEGGATGVPRYLADYVATSDQLAKLEPCTAAGAKLIRDFAGRCAGADTAGGAQVLAVMLTFEDDQKDLRQELVKQLLSASVAQPNPALNNFLRDCCGCYEWKGVKDAMPLAKLTGMDGRTLTLPDDLAGKVVFLQFWSIAHPPVSLPINRRVTALAGYTGLASVPSKDIVVVGVNLDGNRADVEAFLKQHRYSDWIHTFSGLGWADPVVRECDILSLPKTVALDRDGKIIADDGNGAETILLRGRRTGDGMISLDSLNWGGFPDGSFLDGIVRAVNRPPTPRPSR